jgi:phosphatidate phosphatase APP1
MDTNPAKPQKPAAVKLHLGARIDDAIHNFREFIARKRGHRPTVVPYTGYGATGWVRVMCRVLLDKPTRPAERSSKKVRGWRSFATVPLDNTEVTVTVGESEHTVMTDRGGLIDTVMKVELTAGWHDVTIQAHGSEPVEAPVFIVNPDARFGLISDVDDTVMVTSLPRPFLAAWNTFVLDEHARNPVAGMAVLYERLLQTNPGSPVLYLSTGAWNVAPTLTRFLARHLYPSGPLLLTDWGPTHDRWFRSGRDHKASTLERLASEFPLIQWMLVGDDGQHDEELYGEFAEQHPESIRAVAIRQLSTSEAVLAGGRTRDDEKHRPGLVPWVYAPHGAGLAEQLAELGVLRSEPRPQP